ncbi:hypothetical protein K1T71_006130 [Dendrolimus kikuchii]|uniref:Uncharacterized protein n=1 Tax=Dendrolimus kikuchii TaxID=765133 RepID=A0ACC1D389_9NEOP|nr:hypothetical protein K1T71_006130 [Dendrolimus kikuchii]
MIPLYVENGKAYVWNSADWYILRKSHRICGALIGSLPSFPRQNDFLGLPMALLPEESALLVEKGICKLFELPGLLKKPLDLEKQNIKDLEQKIEEEQSEALKKRKIEQLSHKIDIIVAGKKQKLLSKGIADVELDKNTLLQEEINKLPEIASAHLLVHLPTEEYMHREKNEVGIGVLKPSVLEGEGTARYTIFKDLWEKGFHITDGSKFGSHYLLYPGDPVKFHATYMVQCVYDETTPFQPTNLVAFGRLSVAVNKLAVIAFFNIYGRVDYQTIQWHDSSHI